MILVDDLKEFSDFLSEHEITADQFFFCLHMASEQRNGEYNLPDKCLSNFYEYYNNVAMPHGSWKYDHMIELCDKGFLVNMNDDGDKYFDNFEVTDQFLDAVFEKQDDIQEKFEEFWNTYPAFHENNEGKKFNIKAVNKEKLYPEYKKALNKDTHTMIMKALKIGKNRNEVNTRIDKWLQSEFWRAYKEDIREGVDPDEAEDVQQTVI